jgi:Ribbon-helix-helix domain
MNVRLRENHLVPRCVDTYAASVYTGLMKRTTVFLTPLQIKKLGAVAKRTGETPARLIREALNRFLKIK